MTKRVYNVRIETESDLNAIAEPHVVLDLVKTMAGHYNADPGPVAYLHVTGIQQIIDRASVREALENEGFTEVESHPGAAGSGL